MREPEDGSWAELVAADQEKNIGMPLELISAAVYAQHDHISREQYIINVLRDERTRRQAEAHAVSDAALADLIIDGARTAGKNIVEYVLSGGVAGIERERTWDISSDFLAKLLTRYQERFPGTNTLNPVISCGKCKTLCEGPGVLVRGKTGMIRVCAACAAG